MPRGQISKYLWIPILDTLTVNSASLQNSLVDWKWRVRRMRFLNFRGEDRMNPNMDI